MKNISIGRPKTKILTVLCLKHYYKRTQSHVSAFCEEQSIFTAHISTPENSAKENIWTQGRKMTLRATS
jgi:hypothetical protein